MTDAPDMVKAILTRHKKARDYYDRAAGIAALDILRDIALRLANAVCPHCGKRENPCERCGHEKESHIMRFCDACEENARLKAEIEMLRDEAVGRIRVNQGLDP